MDIKRMLSLECTVSGAPGDSKKRVLELLAHTLHKAQPALDEEELFDRLLERERLGSTGIGDGVAIPHCREPNCDDTIGVLVHLSTPINFDAIDKQPVDLVFALVVPEEATDEHLLALQAIAESFSQRSYRERLRAAPDQQSLYQAAIAPIN